MLRRNCLIKHVMEGKIEGLRVTGRQERRRKQRLDYLQETRKYWKLKEGSLDRTMWQTRLVRGSELNLRQVYVTSTLVLYFIRTTYCNYRCTNVVNRVHTAL